MAASEKRKRTTSTFTIFLPEELIYKILTRLPPKSLMRFKCVSKFFNSTIVDPFFLDTHRSLSLTRPSWNSILLSLPYHKYWSSLYTIGPFGYQIRGNQGKLQANRVHCIDDQTYLDSSANGLICVSNYFGDVVVCNLSTGQNILLPLAPLFYSKKGCASSDLYSWSRLYMGFDPFSERYKVFKSECCLGEMKYWIYTVGVENSWREVHAPDDFPRRSSGASVHIDGIIYYITTLKVDSHYNLGGYYYSIQVFDVRIEDFHGMIPFPEVNALSPYDCSLEEVDGRLAIIKLRGIKSTIDVWTFEESREWEKHTHLVPLEEGEIICRVSFLRVGMIMILILGSNSYSVLFNDFKRKIWRKYEICGLQLPTIEDDYNIEKVHSMVEITEEFRFFS